jgi:hypothetical protein
VKKLLATKDWHSSVSASPRTTNNKNKNTQPSISLYHTTTTTTDQQQQHLSYTLALTAKRHNFMNSNATLKMDRTNSTQQHDDEQDRKPAAQPSVPEWR